MAQKLLFDMVVVSRLLPNAFGPFDRRAFMNRGTLTTVVIVLVGIAAVIFIMQSI
jgi:hypothetical protein